MPDQVRDSALERQGRRMTAPALRVMLTGVLILIPGIVLVVVGETWVLGLGIALIFIGAGPIGIGLALLTSASVARWAARHRLFA
jgi:hypothetical protein